MTTITTPQPAYGSLSGFADVLRSEFVKLFTVRSTYWMLLAAVVFNVGLAVLLAIFLPGALSAKESATIDVVRLSLGGIHLSQIAFGVLGALVITSEYGTGMIRATFAAVPRRRMVLTAKATVFTVTALIVGIVSSFAAFFAFQMVVSNGTLQSSINNPGVARAVTGGGLYLAAAGLLGLGLGAIIRVSAGAIATLLGLLFVPPLLLHLMPPSWQATITPYVPMEAGGQIFIAAHPDPGSLAPWAGFGVFALYAALALAAGFILIKRRDP